MNEEDIKLWLALLKEWLDEIGCEDIIEHPIGFSFIYREMKVGLDIDDGWRSFDTYISEYRGVSVVDYNIDGYVDISEFDICNPDTTPSERFRKLKSCLDASCDLLMAHEAFSMYAN